MTEQKPDQAATHFKNVYITQFFLKYDFFRELLKIKGPNLKQVIEEWETTEPSERKVNFSKLSTALKTDVPSVGLWLDNLYEEFRRLPKTMFEADKYVAKYDPEAKTVIVQRFTGTVPVNPEQYVPTVANQMLVLGPPIWKDLHNYAKTWNGNVQEQKEFVEQVKRRIPCGECKNFWIKENRENPAPTDSAENFFKWTVDVHNKVNVKLGKAEMSLEEAKTLY